MIMKLIAENRCQKQRMQKRHCRDNSFSGSLPKGHTFQVIFLTLYCLSIAEDKVLFACLERMCNCFVVILSSPPHLR